MWMLPLTTGHLRVEALRIVDTDLKESIDIRDLPDITVEASNVAL